MAGGAKGGQSRPQALAHQVHTEPGVLRPYHGGPQRSRVLQQAPTRSLRSLSNLSSQGSYHSLLLECHSSIALQDSSGYDDLHRQQQLTSKDTMDVDVRTHGRSRRNDPCSKASYVLRVSRSADSAIQQVRQVFPADWCDSKDVSRSPLYDPTSLELLRMRHLRLRALQHIPGTRRPTRYCCEEASD